MGLDKSKRPRLGPGYTEKSVLRGTIGIQASELDQSILQKAVVTLSTANITGMNGTPVSILPAPGARMVILVDSIHLQTNPGATQFTGGGAVTLQYHGTTTDPHSSNIPAATINSATASNNLLPPPTAVVQVPTNTGIDITNATAAFATGNGTAIVTIWYVIVALG